MQYALIEDGSASSVLVSQDRATLKEAGGSKQVLIGSGFRSSLTENTYTESAALQLNGDLTDLNKMQLKSFAEAELEKHNNVSFRSYDFDADHRVCVIADDAKRLDEFFNTYGGILEIEALLVGSHHPDYATVEEIEIFSAAKGYTLNYTVKAPINRSRCTYCGICGAICPERCILENLHFDFGVCTYCNECVKACPVEAIDLYSIERITLEIPALIILGKPAVTEPENTSFLYHEAQLAGFFETIYPGKVDEIITCDHQICHFNGAGETGCTSCLSACRFGAVKPAHKEIQIDAFACTECGVCAAICPTGALQNRKLTDQMFVEFFRTFELPPQSRVILGSDLNLHRFWWLNSQKRYEHTLFFEIPGDNSFSLMHLLFLISHGAEQIVILGDDKDIHPDQQQTLIDANIFCKKTRAKDQAVSVVSDYAKVAETFPNVNAAPYGKQYKDLSFVNRRRKLSSVVHHLNESSAVPVSFSANQVRHWGTIICDRGKCTQCLACLNVCKIESLSADQGTLTLCWNGGLCIGCSGCVAICPEQALTLKSSVDMSADFFLDQEVSRAEPMRCTGCGKVFGTKKSFDRVIALLTEKQGAPPEHLQYCEDCRILKLMESEQ